MKVNKLAKCPSCSIKLDIGKNPRPYQRFTCPECEAYLEIIKLNPPILDLAFGDSEDYYDNLEFAVWSFK